MNELDTLHLDFPRVFPFLKF